MLWYKLLKNTTYCGKLEVSAYQFYWQESWFNLINKMWKEASERQSVDLFSCRWREGLIFHGERVTRRLASAMRRTCKLPEEGGPVWIKPLLP